MKKRIYNIFSIGYRCNTDEFLDGYLAIRKYSSPFSYMVIDVKSALHFIDTEFEHYTDKEYLLPGNNTNKFNNRAWKCNSIHKISQITSPHADILKMERACIWNHHNLHDPSFINSIHHRSQHLLTCMNTAPDDTLLMYIEKIQKYEGDTICYFDKDILNKYRCHFLILIPLYGLNADPYMFYEDHHTKIIYFNSNYNVWATNIDEHKHEWVKVKQLLLTLYDFQIQDREEPKN